jgi:two-component system sensor histidine kinase PhoQ
MDHRLSINQRSLIAIILSLVCFLGGAGWLLDKAFRDSALQGEQQRLESILYGLLAVTDVTPEGKLSIPNFLADERFNRPNSGLYATINDEQNELLWQSRSALGQALPRPDQQTTGIRTFQYPIASGYLVYSAGIAWEVEASQAIKLDFHIISSPDFYQQQVNQFRKSLWVWFIALAFVLLVVQIMVLKWSLSPLQQVSRDLHAVESGNKQQLSSDYPIELTGLTDNLNNFLHNREQQLGRYRNSLDDLAHSLKTPLAVLRGMDLRNTETSKAITAEQVDRMTRIIDYHLQRAGTAGQTPLMGTTRVKPVVERLVNSLSKVYADKKVHCDTAIENDPGIAVDENDLMELLGNLLDNAYKWCTGSILISISDETEHMIIQVEDDGPGIHVEQSNEVLLRGKRADQSVDGQGIGLALVSEITRAYQGNIEISRSSLGGACITLTFP